MGKSDGKNQEKNVSGLRSFGNGATRDSDADEERYDLISPYFLERLSKIMSEGAKKHGEGNWRLGVPIDVTYNHMLRHLLLWNQEHLSGEKIGPDDHLGKIAFGVMAIAHYEAVGPADYGAMTPLEELKNHPDVIKKKV